SLYVDHGHPVRTSGSKPDCAGIPCRHGLGCPRHPNLTKIFGRYWQAKELRAKADNPFRPPTLPSGSSNVGETKQLLDGRGLPREVGCSAETGDDIYCLPSARRGSRADTLCNDEGGKPELASTEPALHSPDRQDRIEFRRNVGAHYNANPEEDCGPTRPPAPGEQDKDSPVVPPPAQESRASIPRFSDDEPSTQLSISQNRVNLHCHIGRRRHCDTDDGQNDCPIVGSDAEDSEDDVVELPPCKRRRVSTVFVAIGETASQQQTHLSSGDSSSREARRSSQRLKRHIGRSTAHPPSRDSTWDPCAEDGAGYRGTEDRSADSSTKRHHPARQGSKGPVKDQDKPTSTQGE
ncbi:hypothetical protein C8A00DRAFT_19779, partial [Chaetomidium leptoderma]